MAKKFDAVKMARKWREQVSRAVAQMTSSEKIAYFNHYGSVDALLPRTKKKKSLSEAA